MPDPEASQETVFYSDGKGIRVTNSRFIVGQATYTMRNVTSVSKGTDDPNRLWPVLTFLVGLIFLLPAREQLFPYAIYAVVLVGAGVAIWKLQKPTFNVMVSSASGEAEAIASKDQAFIDNILRALNEAIINRP